MNSNNVKQKLKDLLPDKFLEFYHRLRLELKLRVPAIFFWIFRIFPLQNKVIVSTFKGKKYGDSPQYIIEKIHELNPTVDIVWLKRETADFAVPKWVRIASCCLKIRTIYEYCTAKVWLDTHRLQVGIRKRRGQMFIELWHGGLGVKKLEMDVPAFKANIHLRQEINNTNRLADVFVSQSDHLSAIYRRAFGYQGLIWKCGFPKNDILLSKNVDTRHKVREFLGVADDEKIVLYAPSFRDSFYENIDVSVYSIDFNRMREALCKKFGGRWSVVVRWHPLFANNIMGSMTLPNDVLDATRYQDMQELILAVDAMVSDYSSCLFDAALTRIPCFTFATDVDNYKADRGLYYEMEELPFPYATNNDELEQNILSFDEKEYLRRWDAFCVRMGLNETGHAAADIANKIMDFINGKPIEWPNDYQ